MRSTQPDPPPDQGRPSSCRAARSGMALCPICGRAFGVNQIMEHADKCASRSEPASAPARPKQRKQPSAKAAPSPLAQSSSRRAGDGTKRGSSHKFSSQAPTPREGLKVFDMKLPTRLEREVRRADKAIAAIDEAAYVLSDDRGRLSAPRKRRSRPPVEDGAKLKALGCAASSHAAAPAADEEESCEPPAGKHKAHHDVPDDGAIVAGRWTEAEHHLFLAGIQKHGFKWSKVAAEVPTRTVEQIKSHAQKHFRKSDQPEAQAVWGGGSMNSIPAHSSMADASRAAHVSGGSSAVVTAAGAGGNSLDTLAQAARTQGRRPVQSVAAEELGSQSQPFEVDDDDDEVAAPVLRPEPTTCGVPTQRPEPTPKRAFDYLKMTRSRGLPENVMTKFAGILRAIKTEELTVTEMMDQVADLFEGHHDLIIGFNAFLPPEHDMGTVLSQRRARGKQENEKKKKKNLVSYAAARVGVADFPLGPPPGLTETTQTPCEETVNKAPMRTMYHMQASEAEVKAQAPPAPAVNQPQASAPAPVFASYAHAPAFACAPAQQYCLPSFAPHAVNNAPALMSSSHHPMQQLPPPLCHMPAQQGPAAQMYPHGYVAQAMHTGEPAVAHHLTTDATFGDPRGRYAGVPAPPPGWRFV